MSEPRPESRIRELEGQMATQGARIRELHDDSAEELKAIRQEITRGHLDIGKSLDSHAASLMQDMHHGFRVLKEDVVALETRVNVRFDKLETRFDKLETRFDKLEEAQEGQGAMLREILSRLPEK